MLGLGAAAGSATAVAATPTAALQPPPLSAPLPAPTADGTHLPPLGPPAWTDEAPQLSRWIEQGFAAQQRGEVLLAAERYCAAARFGSTEAQYRLGRLFLERIDAQGRLEGRALLAMAAQGGHEQAVLAVTHTGFAAAVPDCLLTGAAPQFAVPVAPAAPAPPVAEAVVPFEVVQRFIDALPPERQRYAELIQRLAPRFEVDFRFALAVARAESNFNPSAVSPKNAMGLMQLIPETAARFGVRYPFNPEQNVRGGLSYLRWLLERFNGDVALAAAAYNAGEGAVERFGGIPPFRETQDYVRRILNFYRAPLHVWPPQR
ncbi:MAG: lytic transglycosylase domain-containing protein [Pseudomonadota bacterium]